MTVKSKYLSILLAVSISYASFVWLGDKPISIQIVSSKCAKLSCDYELILKSDSNVPIDAELRMLALGIPSTIAPTQTYRMSRLLHLLPNEIMSVTGYVDVHFVPASLEVSLYKWQELK